VNKNIDEESHAVHVLRVLKVRHFYHPSVRLRLSEIAQEIV
jgi:hypothetical protein